MVMDPIVSHFEIFACAFDYEGSPVVISQLEIEVNSFINKNLI